MPSLDEHTWLSDELWAQIRPPSARLRKTISAAMFVAAVGALVLSQIGFFHSKVGASFDEASARGNRLTVVLSLYDMAQLPVRVTGVRAAQPGARVVSARANGVFPPDPGGNPAPDGTLVAPFTVRGGPLETVTIVYVLDCAKFHPPLRVNIGTHNVFGNQTSTATLAISSSGPLKQVCPGT